MTTAGQRALFILAIFIGICLAMHWWSGSGFLFCVFMYGLFSELIEFLARGSKKEE